MNSFLVISILIGFFLRLSFVGDMEYKPDEHYMFLKSIQVGVSEEWPTLGMPSGVFLKNPGLSVWIFIVIGKVWYFFTGDQSATALCMAVRFLNSLALMLLAAFIFTEVKKKEASQFKAWAWALALTCVNPLSLIIERKLWAQSVLPIFSVLFVWFWFRRRDKWASFALGFLGLLLGQIHMSGFFYFAVILSISLIFHFRDSSQKMHLKWLFLGIFIGLVPMLPWIKYFIYERPNKPMVFGFEEAVQLKYWVFWIFDSLGVHLGNSLGVRYGNSIWDQNQAFIKYPMVFGYSTYGVLVSYLVLIVLGVSVFFAKGVHEFKQVIKADQDTDRVLAISWIGYGAFLTLATLAIKRYYLVILYPLKSLWLARLSLRFKSGQCILAAFWFFQLILALSFMQFVHFNQGSERGDYGISYDHQKVKSF